MSVRPFRVFTHVRKQLDSFDPNEFLRFVRALSTQFRSIKGRVPIIYVFLDFGWQGLFDTLRDRACDPNFREREREIRTRLASALRDEPIRLVMFDELDELIDVALKIPGPYSLARLFCGQAPNSTYDSPKLVKYLLQVVRDGAGPMLTFDLDVLEHVAAADADDDRTARFRRSLESLLRRLDPLVQAGGRWIVSGQYCDAATAEMLQVDPARLGPDWGTIAHNASATRVMMLAHESPIPPLRLEPEAVARFLASFRSEQLGAASFQIPVSGAGLAMSDSLAIDWPPYSHAQSNTVWIDDGLPCYGHAPEGGVFTSVSDAVFVKPRVSSDQRQFKLSDVDWHLRTYVTALLQGMVVSAFYGHVEWRPDSLRVWARRLPRELAAQQLWTIAREHLRRVADEWRRPEYAGTYLGRYAVHGWPNSAAPRGLIAAVDELPVEFPEWLRSESAPAASLAGAVRVLVDDVLAYAQFVPLWRELVREVRRHPIARFSWPA